MLAFRGANDIKWYKNHPSYIWVVLGANVSKYTIHWASGKPCFWANGILFHQPLTFSEIRPFVGGFPYYPVTSLYFARDYWRSFRPHVFWGRWGFQHFTTLRFSKSLAWKKFQEISPPTTKMVMFHWWWWFTMLQKVVKHKSPTSNTSKHLFARRFHLGNTNNAPLHIFKGMDFSCLEDGLFEGSTDTVVRKLPPFISHEVRPFGRGPTLPDPWGTKTITMVIWTIHWDESSKWRVLKHHSTNCNPFLVGKLYWLASVDLGIPCSTNCVAAPMRGAHLSSAQPSWSLT